MTGAQPGVLPRDGVVDLFPENGRNVGIKGSNATPTWIFVTNLDPLLVVIVSTGCGQNKVIETSSPTSVGVSWSGDFAGATARFGAAEVKNPPPGSGVPVDGDPTFNGDRGLGGDKVVGEISVGGGVRVSSR